MAQEGDSVLHAAGDAVRVFQLWVRALGTRGAEGVWHAIRRLHAARNSGAAPYEREHVGLRGCPGGTARDRLSAEAGRHVQRRAATAARSVRRDGRATDY